MQIASGDAGTAGVSGTVRLSTGASTDAATTVAGGASECGIRRIAAAGGWRSERQRRMDNGGSASVAGGSATAGVDGSVSVTPLDEAHRQTQHIRSRQCGGRSRRERSVSLASGVSTSGNTGSVAVGSGSAAWWIGRPSDRKRECPQTQDRQEALPSSVRSDGIIIWWKRHRHVRRRLGSSTLGEVAIASATRNATV